MKRLLIIAALTVAALVGRAQSEADSVSVMLRHLKDTNEEFVRVNESLKTHAALIGVGGATMLAGTLLSLQGTSELEMGQEQGAKLVKAGSWMSVVGVAFIAASFIPLTRKGVQLDGRGLVVSPSEITKKKK